MNDLTAKTVTATGYITGSSSNAQPARVKTIYYVASGSAGSITLKDGGSGGTSKIVIATPASATATEVVYIPDSGVPFSTERQAQIAGVTSVHAFTHG